MRDKVITCVVENVPHSLNRERRGIPMYLRDIGLYLEYQENKEYIDEVILTQKLTKEEATRQDYRENCKDFHVLFGDQVRCVARLYTDLLGKFKTEETQKINIFCITDLDKLKSVPKTALGFTEVYVLIDLETYWNLSNIEKKKVILEKINEGILQVANHYSWDISIFNRVSKDVIDRNYVYEYSLKQKSSPDRKHKAEIFCQHDIDFITISMIIRNRKTNEIIKSEILITDRPNEFTFVPLLGELKWISNSEITLTHKYKPRKKWIVKLEEQNNL